LVFFFHKITNLIFHEKATGRSCHRSYHSLSDLRFHDYEQAIRPVFVNDKPKDLLQVNGRPQLFAVLFPDKFEHFNGLVVNGNEQDVSLVELVVGGTKFVLLVVVIIQKDDQTVSQVLLKI
jgi:hypothetical protein